MAKKKGLGDIELKNLKTNDIQNFINEKFSDVGVIHNSVRADFSTGHLARDWNCAIINGFKSLTNPDCDILVTCQNDTLFNPTWIEQLIEYHKKYCFIYWISPVTIIFNLTLDFLYLSSIN